MTVNPQSRHGLRAILKAPIGLQQNAKSLVLVEVMAAVENDAVPRDVLAFRKVRSTADNVYQIRRHAHGHELFLDQAVVNDDGVGQVVGLVANGKIGLLGIQFVQRDHACRRQAPPQEMEGDVGPIGVQGLLKVDHVGPRCQARETRCADVVARIADAELQAPFDRIGRVPGNVPTADPGAHLEIVAVRRLEPAG